MSVLVAEDPSYPSRADWSGVLGSGFVVTVVQGFSEVPALPPGSEPAVVVVCCRGGWNDALETAAARWPSAVRVGAVRLGGEDSGDAMAAVRALNDLLIFGILPLPVEPELARRILSRAAATWRAGVMQERTISELRTALERMQEQVARLESETVAGRASVDPLTELWDRQHLVERLEDEANRLERYGTAFGVVLIEVPPDPPELEAAAAELLRDFLRRVDVSARFDDRTFVVVCPSTDDAGMRRLPERLLAAFDAADLPGWPPGASPPLLVATATLDAPPAPPDEALDRLRRAHMAARASGGVVHFDPTQH